MAGNPITRTYAAQIDDLGDEGEEQILAWIAEGQTVKQVLRLLNLPDTATKALYHWRDKTEERKEAWRQAMVFSADSLASGSLDIADEVREDPDSIRKAELRVKVRQWLAGVRNPEYGKEKRTQLTLQIGTMHLTAAKTVNQEVQARAIQKLANPQLEGADYEILPPEPEPDPAAADLYALL